AWRLRAKASRPTVLDSRSSLGDQPLERSVDIRARQPGSPGNCVASARTSGEQDLVDQPFGRCETEGNQIEATLHSDELELPAGSLCYQGKSEGDVGLTRCQLAVVDRERPVVVRDRRCRLRLTAQVARMPDAVGVDISKQTLHELHRTGRVVELAQRSQ